MKNKIYILALILALIIINSFNVWAIGITPGKKAIDYVPGTEAKGEFSVVNTENTDMEVVILVQGEFNQSVSLSEVSFKLGAKEQAKSVSYTLKMPSTLSPGNHRTEIVAVQLPKKLPNGDAFVGSSVGVATQLDIFVPYPGKYAEASLSVLGESGKLTFVAPVYSRGKNDLAKVYMIVDIYGALNEKIASVHSESVSVLSGERKDVVASWEANVTSGNYRAVATIVYDEETLSIEKEFSVGIPKISLENVEVNDFSLGGIAKFEYLVDNQWSQPLTDVYAQMLIYNEKGEAIADFKSQTYNLEPLKKSVMVAFWDSAGARVGEYTSSVILHFAKQSLQHEFKLKVSEDNIEVIGAGYVISQAKTGGNNSLTVILIVVIAVLVAINLLWFLILRKRLVNKK